MRRTIIGLILMYSVAVWAADKIPPMNIKTGLWEITSTSTQSGEMPIPPRVLAAMTPEERAQVEEEKATPEPPETETEKKCVTKEDLNSGWEFGNKEALDRNLQLTQTQKAAGDAMITAMNLKRTLVTATSNKLDVRLTFEIAGENIEETVQVEALSPEKVKGSEHMRIMAGGKTNDLNTTFTGKWIAPVCIAGPKK
jgi:Protein of unknown function (DUF3617)